jgi:polyvinyl alcohol dehydrogenase (cytochrome)
MFKFITLALILLFSMHLAEAQDGPKLFKTFCAQCHEAAADSRAPSPEVLKLLTPEHVLNTLEKGAMSKFGAERSRLERIAIAQYVTGKKMSEDGKFTYPPSAFCSSSKSSTAALKGEWLSWGGDLNNSRHQSFSNTHLNAQNISQLKFKWAFGFPGAASASAQPLIYAGRVYVSSWEGDVFSLDAQTGCIHWHLVTEAGVRAAMFISKTGADQATLYIADLAANVYAANAASGELLWKTKIDDHPLARISGAPKQVGELLYIPVSSREESMAGDPKYPCCTFRGSVVALKAQTGQMAWKTYLIDQAAQPKAPSPNGTPQFGPAGVAAWNSPSIDLKRGLLYIGTGNSYTAPNAKLSDSIVALNLSDGALAWSRQLTPNDMWNGSCPDSAKDHSNCSRIDAPDFDFAAPPILISASTFDSKSHSSTDLIIASQKSGVIYALNPDQKGQTVWETRVSPGGTSGGIMFGSAADDQAIYAGLSDATKLGNATDPNSGGGLVALNNTNGQLKWKTPHPACGDKRPCGQVQTAAVTVAADLVFSGSIDGTLRAYSASTGAILWSHETAHPFDTVNGVKANGGSMSDGGVAVSGNMLFTNSGYSHHSGIMPGNVFLAFGLEAQ